MLSIDSPASEGRGTLVAPLSPILRAGDLPPMQLAHHIEPCTTNPLGVKGAGESGVAGSLPSGVNAVLHALSSRGVNHLDLPLTPPRVWAALQAVSSPPVS